MCIRRFIGHRWHCWAHAVGCSRSNRGDINPNISKILARCGGLPIALSISGCTVALLVRYFGSFERACDIYVTDLEAGRPCLSVERNPRGKSLSDGILLSLKYLQIEFLRWKASKAVDIEHTIRDLYTSLCVLTNQVWIPVSVLGRMWRLDESWPAILRSFSAK